jgi:soluble lytic murein transglycosylase-like protein
MNRAGALRFAAWVWGTVGVCAGTACADSFADRFAAFASATSTNALSIASEPQADDDTTSALALAPTATVEPDRRVANFPPTRAAPRPTFAVRLPETVALPRARTRSEEIVVAARTEPSAAPTASDISFSSWLPRLLPSSLTESAPAPAAKPAMTVAALRPAPADPAVRGTSRPIASDLAALIAAKAHKHGVPVALAHAVVTVESNYNPRAVGGSALGLMQIKHATAQGLGFTGTREQLFDPATNLEWGMRYLSGARKLAKGDLCGTVLRYQAGHRAVSMTQAASEYCVKVKHVMAGGTIMRRQMAEAPFIRQ